MLALAAHTRSITRQVAGVAGMVSVASFRGESQLVMACCMAHAFLHGSLRLDSIAVLRCG
jgi:hypothetical protein